MLNLTDFSISYISMNISLDSQMTQSSIKRNLLQFDDKQSGSKNLVLCEINGWQETYKKLSQNEKAKPRFNAHKKKLFSPFQAQDPLKQCHKQMLKLRKAELMRTPMKLKSIKISNQSTQAVSNDQKKSSIAKNQGKQDNKLEMVHINEFQIEDRQLKKFQEFTLLEAPKKKQKDNWILNFRKESIERLKKIQKLDQIVRQKQMNYSTEIIQENLCRNKYRGLNSLTRNQV